MRSENHEALNRFRFGLPHRVVFAAGIFVRKIPSLFVRPLAIVFAPSRLDSCIRPRLAVLTIDCIDQQVAIRRCLLDHREISHDHDRVRAQIAADCLDEVDTGFAFAEWNRAPVELVFERRQRFAPARYELIRI